MLKSGKVRYRAASAVKEMCETYGFPGIHLDFEYFPPEDSFFLALFLKELKDKMKNLVVSMAVFPQAEFPEKWSRFHDLTKISRHLDEIVIMCYDYHRPGTGPGPVTDKNWADKRQDQ